MRRGRISYRVSAPPQTRVSDVTPEQQPESFYPPLSMKQAIWDSILNGNFIDAKIFAYSRRSNEPGRVDTPKALFVNTHVLAASCSYFQSTFHLSNGIETGLTAGFPPGLDTVIDTEEDDSDSDYDDPVDHVEVPAVTQPTRAREAPAQAFGSPRSVKAYLVNYTPYRTLRAIIWYIYSGDIVFFPNGPLGSHGASAKSIYRFADEHGMEDLRKLASGEITASINRLESSKLIMEAFSVFTSRYPEFHGLYIQRLRSVMPPAFNCGDPFQQQIYHYFSGELPHCKGFLTTLLQTLMSNEPPVSTLHGVGGNFDTISRIPRPWPVKTKNALRVSLDRGIFEEICLMVPSGPESVKHSVYLAGAVGSTIARLFQSEFNQQNPKTSLITWRAIAYNMYADCIGLKPLGLKRIELAPAHGPSEALIHGCPRSPREALCVAQKLRTCRDAAMSRVTLNNVIEEMFHDPPPPGKIIYSGARIVRENRQDNRIRSQLQRILEDAASGDSSAHAAAFSACLIELFRTNPYDQ